MKMIKIENAFFAIVKKQNALNYIVTVSVKISFVHKVVIV